MENMGNVVKMEIVGKNKLIMVKNAKTGTTCF